MRTLLSLCLLSCFALTGGVPALAASELDTTSDVATDPLGTCDPPCMAFSCSSNADCGAGETCEPFGTPGVPCAPSSCECLDNQCICTDDCSQQCVAAPTVPTLSDWGIVLMTVALVGLGALIFARLR